MKNKLLACLVLILAGCCGGKNKDKPPEKITNVSRVFFMGGGSYAVLIENPETKEITRKYLDSGQCTTIKVFADCPVDSKMWVDSSIENNKQTYIIHVHGSDDIAGGNTGGKHPSPINVVK